MTPTYRLLLLLAEVTGQWTDEQWANIATRREAALLWELGVRDA